MILSKNVVVIPTLNEAENVMELLPKLLPLDLDILIVDDSSADGTAEVARSFDIDGARITILSRPSKLGLGSAYIQGFRRCLSLGYENLIQMDADGSHRVQDLELLLKEIGESDVIDLVIGSRWVHGGRIENWSKHREVLSRVANLYSKRVLSTAVNDMTAGFRIYRAELLTRMNLDGIESQGYSFQIEMTREALRVGAVIKEVPITFVERTIGTSKMSFQIVLEAIFKVTKWGLSRK
ncbi:MAG: polyprenol monophosphomannose synthase [Actinobacteria bacterium]|nr:polyprenol monophosphomannose synthase [Actinomycetota bacterium]